MATETPSNDFLKKIMTYCGLLAPIVAFTAIFTATTVHSDWFTWSGHALSDLGALGTSPLWIYNLGLVLTGTLGVIFALRLVDYFDNNISKLGAVFFLVGIFNLSLVGTFPGGTEPHMLVTSLFFGITTLGILIIGIRESIDRKQLGYLWILLIFIGITLTYLTSKWFTGAAIPEMVGAVAFSIFSLVYFGKITTHL